MGQGMSVTITPETVDLKDTKVKSPLGSPLIPESNSDMDLKDCREPHALPQEDIWRVPTSVALQAISIACSVGGVVFQPNSLAASLNGAMSAATFASSWVPQPFEFPVRLVAAASLTTTVFAICNPDAPTMYTALLGLGGTACLLNLGRVVIYEPQQGKGLVQLALILPAAAGIGVMAGPGILPWNPILMTLGASTFAVGMSLQLTRNPPRIYNGLKVAGCMELMAGLSIPFLSQMLTNQAPFTSLYESVCAMALIGLVFQSAFSVPVMCGAEQPKDMEILHHVMTRVNFMMTTMTMVTSFALQYGWSGAPTVACALVCGSAGSLLMTPAWDSLGAAEISL